MKFYEDTKTPLLNNELWETIPINENYMVSNLGRIKNKKTNRILKQTLKKGKEQGYCQLELKKEKNSQYIRVHRIVLLAFNYIENYENFQVDHINGIRDDNRLENLRWTSALTNNGYKDKNNKEIYNLLLIKIKEKGYTEVYNYSQKL